MAKIGRELVTGDVVYLRGSTEISMCVRDVEEKEGKTLVSCDWFEDGKHMVWTFYREMLEPEIEK